MTSFARWLRFNLVGMLGAAVQLSALSLLMHLPHLLPQPQTIPVAFVSASAFAPAAAPVLPSALLLPSALVLPFALVLAYTVGLPAVFAIALPVAIAKQSGGTCLLGGHCYFRKVAHLFAHHPLFAATVALELTLLHNFAWHRRYTWRDRQADTPYLTALTRFHISNGLVSLAGNLVFTELLIRQWHLPVVAANALAILACSLVNFALGERWVFGKSSSLRCAAG